MEKSSKKITYIQEPKGVDLFIEENSNSLQKVKSEDELIMGPINSSVIALNKFIRISLENNFLKDNFVKNLKVYVNYHQPILNQYDNEGLTPLTLLGEMYKSFKTNHYDFSYVANFLIEKGANPDCYTLEGKHFLSFI